MSETENESDGASVLVVDDIPENLHLLVNLLTDRGYDVRPASSSKFALEAAISNPPDLILLDIIMPEMDGYELCRQFKSNVKTRDIPIIFITAKDDIADQTLGFELGAADYITKPFNPAIVDARVRTQLELKQHRDRLEELVRSRTKDLEAEISTRKKTELNLRASEVKLAATIDAFRGFIYTTHMDDPYRITYMNRFLIDHIGYDGTGKLCYEVIFGRNTPCVECDHENIKTGDILETEVQHPTDGKWYYAIHTPQQKQEENEIHRQTILVDITRQKNAEIELKEKEAQLRRENIRLRASMKERFRFGDIIGKSGPMQDVYETILSAAASDAVVTISGESGSGKELVAQAIHQQSNRQQEKMISVNCGAIPENLAESEFFGHVKGAFTGADKDHKGVLEEADGGTLFLDEIGEIRLNLQVKLLRVLDGSGFTPVGSRKMIKPDVRIIVATNQDMKKLVKEGSMREDFFYRIHVVPIKLPPLRERKEDIPLLVEHFLKQFAGKKRRALSGKIMEALQSYQWPGNIRELQNVLNRYVTLNKLDLIDLNLKDSQLLKNRSGLTIETDNLKLQDILDSVEKELIIKSLNKFQWRRDKSADALGITSKTLYRRMNQFQLIEK